MSKINKLSIVIAAYNEKGNIEELINRLAKQLKILRIHHEIILVIDGDDGAFESVNYLIKHKKYANIKISASKKPRGFGNAFKKGFSMVSKDSTHILTLDSDLNHRPEEMEKFFKAMQKNSADIVIGSRFIKGGSIAKRGVIKEIVSRAANIMFPWILGLKVKDISSGYRLYEKRVITQCLPKLRSKNFEFLAEILYRSKKYKMIEIPINFAKRGYGNSKFNLLKTAAGYLRLLFLR